MIDDFSQLTTYVLTQTHKFGNFSAMFVYLGNSLLSFSNQQNTKFSTENRRRFCTKAKIHISM